MSMDAFRTFLDAAADDARIAEGARRAAGDGEGAESVRSLAAYAREAGYDVVPDDVAAFDHAMRSEGELSGSELDSVAGGGPLKDVSGWLDSALATVKQGLALPFGLMSRR